MEEWIPKTEVGRRVKARQITDINTILDNGWVILEPEITDTLLPGMENDLLMIGQSKGKFGGGRRRVFRQTQKKTREGNKPRFAAYAVVGNGDGIVGLGYGKARETVPAREKAMRNAKINLFKIARGSGSWESRVKEPHTVPFAVEGRCGSVRVRLMPAPKGKGLVAEKEVQKILKAAGIQDVWMQSLGQTKNKVNTIKAVEAALKKLMTTRLRPQDVENLAVHYGNVNPIAIAQQKSERAFVESTRAPSAPAKAPAKAAAKPVPDAKEAVKPAVTGLDVSEVKGVGSATAETLKAAGIATAERLASASEDELSKLDGIGPATAKKIIAAASGGKQ
jgi:small subunit ribosomal protein S5